MKSISRKQFEDRDLAIIIDDVEYQVPKRTQAIQDKIIRVNETKGNATEFEKLYGGVEAIMGSANAKKIFPNGKNENLDYMGEVLVGILTVYNHAKDEANERKYQDALDKIKPIAEAAQVVGNVSK